MGVDAEEKGATAGVNEEGMYVTVENILQRLDNLPSDTAYQQFSYEKALFNLGGPQWRRLVSRVHREIMKRQCAEIVWLGAFVFI